MSQSPTPLVPTTTCQLALDKSKIFTVNPIQKKKKKKSQKTFVEVDKMT
jgi:hypothetical protein